MFLAEPEDSFYRDRRDHGTVICLACQEPEETCFCGTFGIDPGDPAGDVSAWQWEDALYLRANTEKGAAAGGPPLEGGGVCRGGSTERTRSILNRLPLRELTTEGFGREEAMLELFHRPGGTSCRRAAWAAEPAPSPAPPASAMTSKEFTGNREILRYRCWDSCMYSDFTIMSPVSPAQKGRFRQRFCISSVFPRKTRGIFGCVGCGRCLRQCPIHMNIVKVMKTLGGAPHESDPLIPHDRSGDGHTGGYPDVKTFRVVGLDGRKQMFSHIPGQCAMLSVPGVGEALFSITSSPTDLDFWNFPLKKCGCVTEWLHAMEPGQQVTLRGPYGNGFPVDTAFRGEGFGVHCRRHRPGAAAVCDPLCPGQPVLVRAGGHCLWRPLRDDLVDYPEIVEQWCQEGGPEGPHDH